MAAGLGGDRCGAELLVAGEDTVFTAQGWQGMLGDLEGKFGDKRRGLVDFIAALGRQRNVETGFEHVFGVMGMVVFVDVCVLGQRYEYGCDLRLNAGETNHACNGFADKRDLGVHAGQRNISLNALFQYNCFLHNKMGSNYELECAR